MKKARMIVLTQAFCRHTLGRHNFATPFGKNNLTRSAILWFPAHTISGILKQGGEGGIRTHGDRKATTLFESAPINHSGTSPYMLLIVE
jgi:hypothetical protein